MPCLRLFSRRALAGFCSAELACITNTPYSDYLLISVVDIQVRAFQEKERLSSYEEAKVTHLWIIHFKFIIWKTIEKLLILRTVFHFQNKFFSRAPTGKAVEIDQVNARIHQNEYSVMLFVSLKLHDYSSWRCQFDWISTYSSNVSICNHDCNSVFKDSKSVKS